MITLQADFNHMDAGGRLRLADLRMHRHTPFAEIAAKHETIIFVDGDDMVRGELIHDREHGWIGHVDWSTQDVWESYPPPSPLAGDRLLRCRGASSSCPVPKRRKRLKRGQRVAFKLTRQERDLVVEGLLSTRKSKGVFAAPGRADRISMM